jgi:hypothetical protein
VDEVARPESKLAPELKLDAEFRQPLLPTDPTTEPEPDAVFDDVELGEVRPPGLLLIVLISSHQKRRMYCIYSFCLINFLPLYSFIYKTCRKICS